MKYKIGKEEEEQNRARKWGEDKLAEKNNKKMQEKNGLMKTEVCVVGDQDEIITYALRQNGI